jgi:Predicted membrane protein
VCCKGSIGWCSISTKEQKTKRKNTSLSVIGAAIFLIIVSVSVLTGKIPLVILAIYVVTSLLTFIMYVVDKSAARRGAWRSKENTLHVLSLAGGWPGALIAQQKLRHKSRKQSFRFVFWVTVLLNCGAFVWLFTSIGTATLQSLIARLV